MRGGEDVRGEETAGETYGSSGRLLFDTSLFGDWVAKVLKLLGGFGGDKPWLRRLGGSVDTGFLGKFPNQMFLEDPSIGMFAMFRASFNSFCHYSPVSEL